MTISEKIIRAKDDYNSVYEAGKREGRRALWNSVTNNGKRTNFEYAFDQWGTDEFYPESDILPNTLTRAMRLQGNVIDLAERMDECGYKIDTSKCSAMNWVFFGASISRIPEINATACKSLEGTFYNANLVTIDKLVLREDGLNTFGQTFYNCKKLVGIEIEGVIGQDISFQYSPLSRASVDNIFDHLKPFGTVWTETDKTWWEQDATGAYPCDKIKVKLKEIPENVTDLYAVVIHSDGEGQGYINYYFDENGECEIELYSKYTTILDVYADAYTIYEGIIHEAPATPPSATFKQTAVDAAYTTEEWDAKVQEAQNKGWVIKTV